MKSIAEITADPAEEYLVERTSKRPLHFKGWVVSVDESSFNNASHCYSGITGERARITVYLTTGKNVVVEKECFTQWQGCRNTADAMLCKSSDDAEKFLGEGWLEQDAMKTVASLGDKFVWQEEVV